MWEVLDPNGVKYPRNGGDGGQAVTLPKGTKIQQADVDAGKFTIGGIEGLVKRGRIKSLLDAKNKKMPKADKKGA